MFYFESYKGICYGIQYIEKNQTSVTVSTAETSPDDIIRINYIEIDICNKNTIILRKFYMH